MLKSGGLFFFQLKALQEKKKAVSLITMGALKLTYQPDETTANLRIVHKKACPGLGDRKTGVADLLGLDYYPFGSLMPGRSFNANEYRFGYNNGSEKDDEITGVTGSHFTTFYREFDTRIGRPWTPDPVFQPWQSPYNSMDNNPIWFNDPLGDRADWYKSEKGDVMWRDSKDATYEYKYLNDKGEEQTKTYYNIGEYYAMENPFVENGAYLFHQNSIVAKGKMPSTFKGFEADKYQSWDAYIAGFSALNGADPDFVKSLIIQETGSFAGKKAWNNDPMQMFHPGDFASAKNIGSISDVRSRYNETNSVKQFGNGILSINSGIQWLYGQKQTLAGKSSNTPGWLSTSFLSLPESYRMAFRYNGSYTLLDTKCEGNFLERAYIYGTRVQNRYINGTSTFVPTGTNNFNWDTEYKK